LSTLDTIGELTLKVEQHIEHGDWVAASAAEAERRQLLTELFSDTALESLDARSRATLQALLARNETLIRSVCDKRRKLAEEHDGFNNAAAALRAYQVHARAPARPGSGREGEPAPAASTTAADVR